MLRLVAASGGPPATPASATPSSLAVPQVSAAPSSLAVSGTTPSPYQFTKTKPMETVDPLSVQFIDNNGARGLQFYTNKGNAATGLSLGEAKRKGASGILDNNGFVTLDPNAQYRIRNERGKDKILYSGTGEEGLRNVYSVAQNLSATKGKKANWGVEMLDPATGQWMRVAEDDPAKSPWGKIADIALPIAGALLAPMTGGASLLGTVGIGAAGAAAGSALSGVAQGKSIGSILKNAALSGALSYAGGSLLQGVGGGAGNGVTQSVGQASGQAAGQAAGQTAAQTAAQVASNAGDIIVTGVRGGLGALGSGAGALAGGALSGLASGATSGGPTAEPGDIEVVRPRPTTPPVGSAAALATLPGVPGAVAAATGNTPPAQSEGGFDFSKLPSYLQLAALGLGGLESLLGGGKGSGGNGRVPGGLGGGLNPVFGGSLPTDGVIPGTGGLRGSQYGPRTMPVQDWSTYATRPEQSFFKQVPQPTLAVPNDLGIRPPIGTTSQTPVTDPTSPRRLGIRMARGGGVPPRDNSPLAVTGAGGGRDDTVPALLSDGEYVIDAETVALLGDGSNKEGARKLDDLRVNIRKHKGRKLSRGGISSNAKQASAYLSGARG